MQKIRRNYSLNHVIKYQHLRRLYLVDHHTAGKSAIHMWPARQQVMFDGWIIRFLYPYAYRFNCIYPLEKGQMDIHKKISKCEQLYLKHGYEFVFQILPQSFKLDHILQKSGYEKCKKTSWMSISLKQFHHISEETSTHCFIQPSNEWLASRRQIAGYTEKEARIYKVFHHAITQKKYPFVLQMDHVPVACGLGIQVGSYLGIFDVRTKVEFQRQGYARSLVQAIISHAQKKGVSHVQLHVDIPNTAAINLYQQLGFRRICDYWFRRMRN
ncbi:MAG: GNAT family N-acetyltransferase [Candidatus Magnetomorum sp.]|nr:GNAT family N-acetyltransferase [Candidatus Magnetomorum sp.]